MPVPGWEQVALTFREPPRGFSASERRAFEEGWRALTLDDLQTAHRQFESLARKKRDAASVDAALGYLELRQGDWASAEEHFFGAIRKEPRSTAALAGLAQAALATNRDPVSLERLQALERVAPDHPVVVRYLPPLKLRLAELKLQQARRLREQQSYREAAALYKEALAVAPEASGLQAEVAEVELLSGDAEAAVRLAAIALETEGANGSLLALYGDALIALGRLEPAVEAYTQARALLPGDSAVAERLSRARAELERQSMPPEYFAIEKAERLTREQLAALLAVKLHDTLQSAPRRANVIATDFSGSWARDYIQQVVAVGLLNVFPNHTFQPQAFVRRSELAVAFRAALETLSPPPAAPPEPTLADVPRDHVNYEAVAQAVALGLLPVDTSDRFEPLRFVSGQEAIEAVDALSRRVTP